MKNILSYFGPPTQNQAHQSAQNGALDFECTIDRPWNYCTYELFVSSDMIGNAISILISNARNVTANELDTNNWNPIVLVDSNEYDESITEQSFQCSLQTSRVIGINLDQVGVHTLRLGNAPWVYSTQGFAQGTFEFGISNVWRPREVLVVDQPVSRIFTRWADVHSFRVNITDSTSYVVTVETPTDTAVQMVLRDTERDYIRYDDRGVALVRRTIFSPTSAFVAEVSPLQMNGYCREDLDSIVSVQMAYNFTVTLSVLDQM